MGAPTRAIEAGARANRKVDDQALAAAIKKIRKLRLIDHVAIMDDAPPAVTMLGVMQHGLGGCYDDAAFEYIFRRFLKYYITAQHEAAQL